MEDIGSRLMLEQERRELSKFLSCLHRYQTIRTQLEQIFGPKVHKDFPRKLLMSSSCGDGFWETNGKGHYNLDGIMLEVNIGHKVCMKHAGCTVN